MPINYYSDMAGTIIDQYILNKLVEVYLPDIHKLFHHINFEIAPITLQWFVSLFAQNLNYDVNMTNNRLARAADMGYTVYRWKYYFVQDCFERFKNFKRENIKIRSV